MAKENRKQLVIEPVIQYSLIRQLLVQWGLHLVATLVLLTILQVFLGGFFNTWQYHLERIGPTLASFTVSLLFLLPVYVMNSLKLSNRFAGPIHRFRRELRSVAEGRPYRELKFRDNDYWTELAEELDLAINAIRDQIAAELKEQTSAAVPSTSQSSSAVPRSGIVLSADGQIIPESGLPQSPSAT